MELTQELLRSFLDYEPETGRFLWRVSRGKAKPGKQAGRVHHEGYVTIMIGGREYGAHRLAWLHAYGKWPDQVIDHINGNRSDNRLENLRDVTCSANQQNRRAACSSNKTSGLIGVTKSKGRSKYRAEIQVNGRSIHLGVYDTKQDAHEAYLKAKKDLHSGYIA